MRADGEPVRVMPSFTKVSILVVDDDRVFRERLGRSLAGRGYAAHVAADAERALEIARAQLIEHAVIDLRMPGMSGLVLLADLLRIHPPMRIVVLTGYGSIASAVEAMRLGAHGYLAKPADADDVVRAMADERPDRRVPAATPPATLARAEWEHIQRILADTGGNISESSRRLGITRRTLQLKLKKDPPRA